MRSLPLGLLGCLLALPAAAAWEELADGLDVGSFHLPGHSSATLEVLRVDPARWEIGLHCAAEQGWDAGLTAKGWSEKLGLVAAINAGMFGTDYVTHIGYLRDADHVNNARRNVYKSVAAFRARTGDVPPFRIADLDVEGASIDSLVADYEAVVQNLRLIKRPRENRWSPQDRRWSEAALGEDGRGRALLMFCRVPMSMHELNEALLKLEELDLVCAQHLEGGPQAQLWVHVGDRRHEWVGRFDTDDDDSGNDVAWPVPNVIGVRARR